MNKNLWRIAAAGAGVVLLTSAYHRTQSIPTMTATAKAFLSSLSADQKKKANLEFAGEERLFWHYIPTDDIPNRFKKPRMGLIIAEMNSAQRALAHSLLAAGLSQTGAIKATSIMSLEDILKVMEKDTKGRRNPEKYHFSVFGTPSETGTWGYRIEGHHVSLHFTVANGKIAGTPTFFGANPHEVREGERAGLRVLAAEEDLGRDVIASLDDAQRKTAIVTDKAYADIITEASRKAALNGQPSGLPVSKMNAKQFALLQRLIEEYVSNVPDQVAQARRDKVKKAGKNMHFAWAGGVNKGDPHYYRVAAPAFLIEYDNTQNGANHSHTVWREYDGDFGLDLLGEHLKSSHGK